MIDGVFAWAKLSNILWGENGTFGFMASVAAEPDIVFVSNSYVQSNNLPRLVEGVTESVEGWENATTIALTAGGLTLADHANRMMDANSTWAETFRGTHDWFIFQDQSQIHWFTNRSVLARIR